jgi:hypothetical protein
LRKKNTDDYAAQPGDANMKRLVWVAVRQSLLGLAAVAASFPLLLALSHALGLGRPPLGGLATLGGSVVLAFAGGGLIGALLASVAGNRSLLQVRLAAALAGLVYGFVLCSAVLPLYTDDVLDELTDRGTEIAIERAPDVLDRPAGAVNQATDAAGKLVHEGAVYIPALALLGWTLLGPALAAPIEVRRPRQGHTERR